MRRYLVGISGASGSILAIRLLQELRRDDDTEVHLVVSPAAWRTLHLEEPEFGARRLRDLAHVVHGHRDVAAPPASGGFAHDGMVIVPCSIATASELSLGIGRNLLARAADVTLKEGRRLIVVPRESPMHAGHLEALARLARLGACILPPMLAFYHRPRSVADLVDHVVARILERLGREQDVVPPWPGGGPDV